MNEPKFSASDVLKPVLDDTGLIRCHVVEVQTQACSMNAQIFYHCRVHTKLHKDAPASMTCKYIAFNEIEVEKWPE